MARSIQTIQQEIADNIVAGTSHIDGLSPSKVADWRLLSRVAATAVHAFEVVQDIFKAEIESKAYMNTPGTVPWYEEMSRRYQHGHKLVYDKKTASYTYAVEDLSARIIEVVAIVEKPQHLFIKVAKKSAEGKIVPLSDAEYRGFTDYWRTMRMGGTRITIISTTADTVRYDLVVYYDPSYPAESVEENVQIALDEFRTSLSFNAIFYTQRLLDSAMSATGVVTVDPQSIEHKSTENGEYSPVGVSSELAAGYFDYDDESVITLTSIVE